MPCAALPLSVVGGHVLAGQNECACLNTCGGKREVSVCLTFCPICGGGGQVLAGEYDSKAVRNKIDSILRENDVVVFAQVGY